MATLYTILSVGVDVANPPDYVSHSAISQYLRCSEQYRLERIEKVPTPPAWYFIGGKAVHLATQWLDEGDDYPYSDEQLKLTWLQAYDQEIQEAFEGWPEEDEWLQVGRRGGEQTYEFWSERGFAAVKAWHEWRVRRDWDMEIDSIEEEIEVPLPSGIILKGYIDRIFRENLVKGYAPGPDNREHVRHVLDIKTGTKRPSSPLQLGFYKIGLEIKKPGLEVESGAWWMAKDGKAYPVPIDHITIDKLDTWAQAYYRGVGGEVFIPNVGDACFFCSVKDHCSAYPKVGR